MTLIEALKSGKSFGRDGLFYILPMSQVEKFSVTQIFATDWEIIEPKVEITREQLEKAYNRAKEYRENVSRYACLQFGHRENPYFDEIAKELGL